jgi:phage-related tail fiber protein
MDQRGVVGWAHRPGVLGACAIGAMLALGTAGAEAATVVTTVTADISLSGPLDGSQVLTVPGFTGLGTLTSVSAVYTIQQYSMTLSINPQSSGVASYSATSALALTQPPAFQIGPDTTVSVTTSAENQAIFPGFEPIFDLADIGAPVSRSFTATSNLSSFVAPSFVFTVTATGSFTAPAFMAMAASMLAAGSLVVTYTSEFDGLGVSVPEPSGLAVLGIGLGAITWMRRRRAR